MVCALLGLALSPSVRALDPEANIERAVGLIETQQYRLARSYLGPALIAPRLHPGERSRAYYLRGFTYVAQGMYVSAYKDYNRALEFNPSNPVVLVEIGQLHAYGRGLSKSPELAYEFFLQAAEQDYPRGQFFLGNALLNGSGVAKDIEAAREWLLKAAEQDHGFAMMNLAASYREQSVDQPDPNLALEWYEKALAAGETGALLSIGFMHGNGELGDPDQALAVEYYAKADAQGLLGAKVSLAYAYLVGEGVEQDLGRAFELYSAAGDAGLPSSFIGIGHMYENGLGVKQDTQRAIEWYEQGAEHGLEEAMLRLVSYYLRQDSQDAREAALEWSRRAAEVGSAQAFNDYAWQLATSKFDGLRNGTLALDQAIKAVAVEASAAFLDTLAAAYAELGDFEQAVATQEKALAGIDEDDAMREGFEDRLAHYQRSQPWRE